MLDIQTRSPSVPPAIRTAIFWKYSWLAPANDSFLIVTLGFFSWNAFAISAKISASTPVRLLNRRVTGAVWPAGAAAAGAAGFGASAAGFGASAAGFGGAGLGVAAGPQAASRAASDPTPSAAAVERKSR